jgi:hypothetical protein
MLAFVEAGAITQFQQGTGLSVVQLGLARVLRGAEWWVQ